MALVRISQNLVDVVTNRIIGLQTNEIETHHKRANPAADAAIVNEVLTLAERHAWGDHIHLKPMIPSAWLKKEPSIDSVISYPAAEGILGRYPEIKFQVAVTLPPGTSTGYQYYQYNFSIEQLTPESAEKVRAYFTEQEAIRTKFESVKNQVAKFLHSCKSLNDAVKKYPDILLYVPQEYKDRLERKVERGARGEKDEDSSVPEIDRALITSIGVIGAITGT